MSNSSRFAPHRTVAQALVWIGLVVPLPLVSSCSSPPPPEPKPSSGFDDLESKAVQTYLELSEGREDRGDLDGAMRAADKARAAQPRSRQAHLRRTELLFLIGRRDVSETQIAEAHALLAEAHVAGDPESTYVQARFDLAEGRSDAAVDALHEVVAARPGWPQAHRLLGVALLASGDRTGALEATEKALELDESYALARADRARIMLASAEPWSAAADARQALRVRPDDDELRLVLAEALALSGRYEEAERAIAAIPESRRTAEAFLTMARLQELRGKDDVALASVEAAAERQPEDPEILALWLEIDTRAGSLDSSIERLEAATASQPENAELQALLALALGRAGRSDESMAALRRSFELDSESFRAHSVLTQLLVAESDPEQGLAKALDAGIPAASAHVATGSLYTARGDSERGLRHSEEALELNPRLAVAKNSVAYKLTERGDDLDRARALAREARAALPGNSQVADTLGWVLYRSGQYPEAVALLQESLGALPPNSPLAPEVSYHLAVSLEALGEPTPAWRHLRHSLNSVRGADPPPTWMADAEALQDRMKSVAR